MFRQMLMGSARAVHAPENDEGAEFDDEIDTVDEIEDEDLDEDEGEEDEAEDEDLGEEQEETPPVRQPTRGENRIAAATRAAKEAKAEAAAVKAELAALKSAQTRPQGETQAQRHERLSNMEPWERTEFLTNERLAALEWNGAERLDKISFDAVCRDDPVAAKLKGEIEARLAQMRASGQNVDRETLYTHMLGERARANKGRATGRAQKTANANRDRQTTRPSNSRGDSTTSDTRRGDTAAARAKRLENIEI